MTQVRRGDQITGLPHDPLEQLTVSRVNRTQAYVVIGGSYVGVALNRMTLLQEVRTIRYFRFSDKVVSSPSTQRWTASVEYLGQIHTLLVDARTPGSARNKAVGIMSRMCGLTIPAMAGRLKNRVQIKPQ